MDNASHEKPHKPLSIKVIDSLIIITIISALFYTYAMNTQVMLKLLAGFLLLISVIWVLIVQGKKSMNQEWTPARINKLVLLDEEGESLKEWYIQGATSLLIGKGSTDHEVDIDLHDVEYASLISKEHAVLNYYSGNWYLEDIDSQNGVGIRKGGERAANRLEVDEPLEIDFGDVIYIANTRLLVK